MAVIINVNGNAAGDGFLLAPLDSNYDAEIKLSTDGATIPVTIQAASPNPAGLVFSATTLTISPAESSIMVHSTMQSSSRGDTIIQVLDAALTVLASFSITSIKHPVINFKGRFEARFATQPALFNQNAMYTAVSEAVGPGWTWGLEGEPDFVPIVNNIPENLETPGMGRVIRLNNPVALRSHAAPVISTVYSIAGDTAAGTEIFLAGDPLIGQPVNFGTDTYFAGNREKAALPTPQPEEYYTDAEEPMALFEIHLGNPSMYFKGASGVGPFTHKATSQDEKTRVPDSRPIATGLESAATEIAEFGLPALQAFSATRIDQLIIDFNALPAGASPARRNLVRRIGHLLSSVSAAKRSAVQAANPGAFTVRPGTIPIGWTNKEVFNGKVDTNLHALPGGSSVIDYLRQFFSFDFQWNPFSFHSDELCGHHKGMISGNVLMTGNHIGDPHTHTVNGTNYDFQAVGEFTLLRDGNMMEVQVRQTPVATANPITDSYSGLTACVSVITAVAARVGRHIISLQPRREGKLLQFYLDGKPTNLLPEGIDLGGSRVSAFDANGEKGLRVDYQNRTVLLATPAFWSSNNIWYINVNVSNTRADEGVMGYVPKKSWLPRLRNGVDLGPKPINNLHDCYITLYKTFADSWRVNGKTSLFIYEQGTSTETFTDHDWPSEQIPCKLKPEFQIPGTVVHQGMPVEKAEIACKLVKADDLHKNCVFDVATTGDEIFVKGYVLAEKLRRCSTLVHITGKEPLSIPDRSPVVTSDIPSKQPDRSLLVIATVSTLTPGQPNPKGSVVFYVNNKAVSTPVKLDGNGRAKWKMEGLEKGESVIRANYIPDDITVNYSSCSPNLNFSVTEDIKEQAGGINKGCLAQPWYIWFVLILIILLVVWFLITR